MATEKPTVRVRLMGKAAELVGAERLRETGVADLEVAVSGTSPREILQEIARANPLIADQIIRGDGTPRSSTKVLVNGKPPADLDMRLATRQETREGGIIIVIFTDDIVIIIFLPCDG